MATIAELDQSGWTNKIWQTRKGTQRGGSQFTKATLFRLLTNVTYIGKLGYKDEVNEGEQDAIINTEVWQKVQSLLRRNGRTGGVEARNKFGALLRGILRCACCDYSMTPTQTTKNGVKRYRYYVCIKAQKRGWKYCKSKSVPATEIEKFVVDKIRHVGHDAALVDEVVEQAKIQSERELGTLVAERDGLVKELEYWNEAIRIAAPTIKPGDPKSTSLEQLADWHESLHRAEHRHMIVASKLQALQAQTLIRDDVVNALTSFEPIWESLTVREQSRIVQLIVKQVDYDGSSGRVTITFHPDGIKTIVMEKRPELHEAAS